jgi:acyl carrier protein
MGGPGIPDIEAGVIEAVTSISRRPVVPSPGDDLVADLGFDSLEVLELVAELEQRFGITVPEEQIPASRTIAQVVAQVARLVAERGSRV